MRILVTIFLLLIIPSAALAQSPRIRLEEKSFLDGKLSLLMPKAFEQMGEDMLRLKYPMEHRPTIVYTNESGSVNVAINHTNDSVLPSQLPELRLAVEETLKKLHPTAKWFRNKLVEINGRQFFLFDFRSQAVDTQVRNIMLGTSLEGRFLIISFNSTLKMERVWMPIGEQVIESVRVRA